MANINIYGKIDPIFSPTIIGCPHPELYYTGSPGGYFPLHAQEKDILDIIFLIVSTARINISIIFIDKDVLAKYISPGSRHITEGKRKCILVIVVQKGSLVILVHEDISGITHFCKEPAAVLNPCQGGK